MTTLHRRHLLASAASVVFSETLARADIIHLGAPWEPAAGAPPRPFKPGPWHFLTPAEGQAVEAIVGRLIPADGNGPGAKELGVADFIDRQLAGPFGRDEGHYMEGPFKKGTKEQGDQSPYTPAQQYRMVLAALDAECRRNHGGRPFAALPDAEKDALLSRLETGDLRVPGVESEKFFTLLLKNTREGFFADPIYGGNRDMAAWTWIGFPGARYDYSDWIDRHNERYPEGPISIAGAPDWSVRN